MRKFSNNIQQTSQGITEQVPFSIGTVHHNLDNLTPASSEVAHLWISYEAETMAICFLKSWVKESIDPEIHSLLQQVLDTSTERVQELEKLFNTIKYPIPMGFGEKDVNVNAPTLFSETFTCLYIRMMQGMIAHSYTLALVSSYRSDFKNFFSNGIKTSVDIENKATEILLAKGILNKHPSIVPPRSVENITSQSFLGSFLGLGEDRPLNSLEISHIYKLMETIKLKKTLNMGYAQVVKSKKIRDYFLMAKEIDNKHLEVFGQILNNQDVPIPSLSEILITDSRESSFSDKLVLNHSTATATFIATLYGTALAAMARKDLVATIGKLLTEVLGLAKDGAELLIEFGWLEQIPLTADRQELTH